MSFSASKLQWGRDLSVAEGPYTGLPFEALPSFNGAATFRSRKVENKISDLNTTLTLQWGRDLSVAEG